ncbi:MAG: porin, partial [Acetobacteraceae bacterium]
MKKILLATSAVALFAGAAAAEVTTTGTARMGLVYFDDGTDTTTQFSSRIRIIFTASGETDTGLSFGASVRNDQSGVGGTSNGDSTVYISGAFGKLTMGDVSGAADSLVGQTSGVGYGPNDGLQEINFIGAVKTAVYYEYSTGAFTFGLGAGQLDTVVDDTYSIGVKYATDAYSVALAWESSDVFDDMLSLGGSATFGAATLKARVSDRSAAGFDTSYSVSVDYAMGATTLTAFYTDFGNNAATT